MVENFWRRRGAVTVAVSTSKKLLQKRKFYVRALVFFTVFMLLIFNLASWLFLNQMKKYLEKELEKRLVAIANLAAQKIETDYLDAIYAKNEGSLGQLLLKPYLSRLLYDFELESVFIINPQNVILIDAQNRFPDQQELTYLEQDSTILETAWSGTIAASPIHIIAGNKFKSVYAPLHNEYFEVAAVLVLEASADFFRLLDLFRRGLIIGGLASFALIIIFSFFISWIVSLLIKTHNQMQQSEKLAAMGQMAASMAHEMRNPLGIIKSTADVLKEKYAPKDQSDELFDFIFDEVQRLNHLVNNFLSFAREPKLNLVKQNLKPIIEKVISALQRDSQNPPVAIEFQADDDLPEIAVDENGLQQVLFNLILNAQQALPEENGKISIALGKKQIRRNWYALISVHDNGSGITGELEKIFEPFYTTKSSGSGLGLAISRQLIEKHGGWMDVESTPGEGTTFYIYLPIK